MDTRLDMLAEAIAVIRELWSGSLTTFNGEHYVVENARIYTLPERLPEIPVSGFGPKAISLAAEVGEGFMTTMRTRRTYGPTGTVW